MVVIAFLVMDKANSVKFFEKTFLIANVGLEVVYGMSFLTLSNADVDFLDWELWWRTYITKEALLTIKCVKLVRKKEFAVAALDLEYKTFIVHIASLSSTPLVIFLVSIPIDVDVHLFCRSQVSGLTIKEAFIKVLNEYIDFADVFSPDLVIKLPNHTRINNDAIELVDGQQLSYGPIYSLGLVKLEILKAYIRINLANGFIKISKSSASTPIPFD